MAESPLLLVAMEEFLPNLAEGNCGRCLGAASDEKQGTAPAGLEAAARGARRLDNKEAAEVKEASIVESSMNRDDAVGISGGSVVLAGEEICSTPGVVARATRRFDEESIVFLSGGAKH